MSTHELPLGIYIHVPFCLRKCAYCDFFSEQRHYDPAFGPAVLEELRSVLLHFQNRNEQTGAHTNALLACPEEASQIPAASLAKSRRVESIYFGGGTPSLMSSADCGAIIEAIASHFDLNPKAEITLEANPATVDIDRLQRFRAVGVNRLSVGVQSLDDRWLAVLGRLHSADQAYQTITSARRAGFDNIGADWILGLPGQTQQSCEQDGKAIAGLELEHISAYALTLEPTTDLHRAVQNGTLPPPEEDEVAAMLLFADAFLPQRGFEHYEISNFATQGRAARHNRLYWTGGEVLALGPGGHSHFRAADNGGLRFANGKNLDAYLHPSGCQVASCFAEHLTPRAYLLERIYLGLRDLNRGVQLRQLAAECMLPLWPKLLDTLEELVCRDLLRRTNQHIVLSRKGLLLADLVSREVLGS